MKEKYTEYANKTFEGKALEIVLNQINLFYKENITIKKKHYNLGDNVFLKKGTFIHGIFGGLENFDYTVNNGFISTNFTGEIRTNKFFNSVGMWNIQNDCLLKDYIKNYSGVTLEYNIGRGPGSISKYILIPYHKFEDTIEKIANNEEIWSWSAEQTKEIRFLPSLASEKRQIAFILNMESEYANKMKYADIFNREMNEDILKYFVIEKLVKEFNKIERNALTTDRESSIMFGLPIKLVEGILVGRKIENDKYSLEYIKSKLPDCYICNLDGVVIK